MNGRHLAAGVRRAVEALVIVGIGGVTAFAAWFRLRNLSASALTNDEAFTWRVCQDDLLAMLRRIAADAHPPGHFLLERGWIALFGDSPLAIRSLSAAAGVACVPLTYLLCRAAAKPSCEREGAGCCDAGIAALVASALVAVNSLQIEASRTGRMYSWAALFSAISAWMLLRALRGEAGRTRDWTMYGVAAGLFLYMHHFAWLTILAQCTFAAADIAFRISRGRRQAAKEAFGGLWLSASIAIALYGPWLIVFFAQATRVRDGLWIEVPSSGEFERMIFSWLTGLAVPDKQDGWLFVTLVAMIGAWSVVRRNRVATFFLWQATLPWACAAYITFQVGRPLFRDPYFAMAQMSLPALWCATYYHLRIPLPKAAIALVVGVNACQGALQASVADHRAPPALVSLAAYLSERYRETDVVVAADVAAANRVRYYLAQAGLRDCNVKCYALPHVGRGQSAHTASLHRRDVLPPRGTSAKQDVRFWCVGKAPPPSGKCSKIGSWLFGGGPRQNTAKERLELWQ